MLRKTLLLLLPASLLSYNKGARKNTCINIKYYMFLKQYKPEMDDFERKKLVLKP